MNKIFIHKTKIGEHCKIDAYLFQNNEKDIVYFALNVPNEKEDLIDSFIELCNDVDSVHIDIYNFVKKELNVLCNDVNNVNNIAKDNIITNMNIVEKELNNIKTKVKDGIYYYDINSIVNEFRNLGITYNIINNLLYKDNSNTKVPDILCNYFHKAIEKKDYDYLISLDLFWTNCLKRDIQSNIKDLFLFIDNNQLTITPNGYLFCFRRIVKKNELSNQHLFEYVINTWKELVISNADVNNVYVGLDKNEYYTTLENNENTKPLLELVNNYFSGKDYTPLYTDNHTKKFEYKVGGLYVVDNVDNNPDNTCSYGLHIGSKEYVKNNTWLGEQIVGCIVNPRDIIAVSDYAHKLRVRKMFIACLINDDELEDFNPAVYHYDYTNDMITDDDKEFIDYKFNENYKKVDKYQQLIVELENKVRNYQDELNLYTQEINTTKDEIIKLLKNNYKS